MRTIKSSNFRLLIALFAIGLSLSACDTLENLSGTNVSFNARVTDSAFGKTKVAYGDAASAATSQSILWNNGDLLTVYCGECIGLNVLDYRISGSATKASAYQQAKIEGVDSKNLAWGSGLHTFYALSPGVNTSGVSATINGNEITGTIPSIQAYTSITGTTAKVVEPDMKNMFLVAKTMVSGASSSVSLDFQPLSTALEFTVTNKFDENQKAMRVNSVSLVSSAHALSGEFAVDMDAKGGRYNRPLTTLPVGIDMATSKTVSIQFSSPVNVGYEETLNFTFFLNPGNATEVNDLTLVIRGYMGDSAVEFTRSAHLETSTGSGITFETHKKTRISGLLVPETVAWDINGALSIVSWTSDINSNVSLEEK